MKLFKEFIIISLLILSFSSISVLTSKIIINKEKDDLTVLQNPLRGLNNIMPIPTLPDYFNPQEHPEIWANLFTKDKIALHIELRSNCPISPKTNVLSGDKFYRPSKKPNRYALMGHEDSSYFFDFLDNVFFSQIISKFSTLISEMNSLERYSNTFEDPYHLNMLLYGKFDLSVNEKDLITSYK